MLEPTMGGRDRGCVFVYVAPRRSQKRRVALAARARVRSVALVRACKALPVGREMG